MDFYDEKDYIMRIIKEMVKVLLSLMLGKQYSSVELPKENKYEVSGNQLKDLMIMIDHGDINDAEAMMLCHLDYSDRSELTAAILLYQYISEKNDKFLQQNHYSKEKVLDGLRQLAEEAGYKDFIDILE